MKTHTLNASAPLASALAAGARQVRLPIKEQQPWWSVYQGQPELAEALARLRPPYRSGDVIQFREAYFIAGVGATQCGVGYSADHPSGDLSQTDGGYNFRSLPEDPEEARKALVWAHLHEGTERWLAAGTMPQWAIRHRYTVVAIRAERVAEIGEADAQRCMGRSWQECEPKMAQNAYRAFWETVHGKRYPWSTSWAWTVDMEKRNA